MIDSLDRHTVDLARREALTSPAPRRRPAESPYRNRILVTGNGVERSGASARQPHWLRSNHFTRSVAFRDGWGRAGDPPPSRLDLTPLVAAAEPMRRLRHRSGRDAAGIISWRHPRCFSLPAARERINPPVTGAALASTRSVGGVFSTGGR